MNKDDYPIFSFFTYYFNTYGNFSIESIDLDLGEIKFGRDIEIILNNISPESDLIGQMILNVKVPEIHLNKSLFSSIKEDFMDHYIDIDEYSIYKDYQSIDIYINKISNIFKNTTEILNITNQNAKTFLDKIIDFSTIINEFEESNYINSLDKSFLFTNYSYLNKINTNIKFILKNIKEGYDINNISIKVIYGVLENIIENVKKIKIYYHKLSVKYSNIDNNYLNFAWINNLGINIIKEISIEVDGNVIDSHNNEWLYINNKILEDTKDIKLAHDDFYGNYKNITTFDSNIKPSFNLLIPLRFWFNKDNQLYFPISSLKNSLSSLKIRFKNIENCCVVEKSFADKTIFDVFNNMNLTLQCSMYIELIKLDKIEEKRFKTSNHECLIETIQRLSIKENLFSTLKEIKLFFKGTVKDLFWFVKKDIYNSNDIYINKYPNSFSIDIKSLKGPIKTSEIVFSGKRKILSNDSYFNILQPSIYHEKSFQPGLYYYSFSLYPNSLRPSGSCNFSAIKDTILNISIDPEVYTYNFYDLDPLDLNNNILIKNNNIEIVIFARKYNILKIKNGFCGFNI